MNADTFKDAAADAFAALGSGVRWQQVTIAVPFDPATQDCPADWDWESAADLAAPAVITGSGKPSEHLIDIARHPLLDYARAVLITARRECAINDEMNDEMIEREALRLEERLYQECSSFVDNEVNEFPDPA